MFHPRPCVLVAALLAACATPVPAPLTPPQLEIGARHFAGTVLTGRRAGVAQDLVAPAFLSCRIRYAAGLRDGALRPLATRTRLVVSGAGGEPLRPVAELASGARVGAGDLARSFLAANTSFDDPSRAVPLCELRGALPVGVTVACSARSIATTRTAEFGDVRKRVVVLVSHEDRSTPPSVALQIDDLVPGAAGAGAGGDVLRRQLVLLQDAPVVDGAPLVLEFPSPFRDGTGRAFVVAIELRSTAPDAEALLERCRGDLAAESAEVRTGAAPLDAVSATALGLGVALRSLNLAEHHRPGLVFLADSVGADLALDLSLVADDATLAEWVRVAQPGGAGRGTEDLGWTLERSAYALLAGRSDTGELSDELAAVLVEHAGAAARIPGAIAAVLARVGTRAELQEALRAENLLVLESTDPSNRVRAHDWLAARGLAPPGYDPLAGRQQRRAALAAARKEVGK